MDSGRCGESFGHDEIPGIVAPVPNGHSGFRMPCSNPHKGHQQHRVHYEHEADGRVWDIVIEWAVKDKVYVSSPLGPSISEQVEEFGRVLD